MSDVELPMRAEFVQILTFSTSLLIAHDCMYVCIYLFIRHGYLQKLYSDNENNYIFGWNIQSNISGDLI